MQGSEIIPDKQQHDLGRGQQPALAVSPRKAEFPRTDWKFVKEEIDIFSNRTRPCSGASESV